MALEMRIHKQLDKFRLDVHIRTEAKTLCLLGPSGAGKTMTINCIAGLMKPDEGFISINGVPYFDAEKKINVPSAARKVGYVFQNYALFPHMTVLKNVTYGLRRLPEKQKREKGMAYLKMARLDALWDHFPSELSGGQQQRVALMRSLILSPDILMLDEPFSALDGVLKRELQVQVMEILSRYKGQTIFVTHNIEEAYDLCDFIAVYSSGHIIALDKKEAIFLKRPQTEVCIAEPYRQYQELLRG